MSQTDPTFDSPVSPAKDNRRPKPGIRKLGRNLSAAWRSLREGPPKPVVVARMQAADIAALLDPAAKPGPPVEVFRELSEGFRLAGEAETADRICSRGVELHPENLWLAQIHAKIADRLGDRDKKIARWSRVIELAGGRLPLVACKQLAQCYLEAGEFEQAEELIRRGTADHPEDLPLAERLGKLRRLQGRTAEAIAIWEELAVRFAGAGSSWISRKIAWAYRSEGMLDRAIDTLRRAAKHAPNDQQIAGDLETLESDGRPSAFPGGGGAEEFTAHLYHGNTRPFGRGVVSSPNPETGVNRHVPAMLDFGKCLAPLERQELAAEVDVFTNWGWCGGWNNQLARRQAMLRNKPSLSLEFGFISFPGSPIYQSPGHSLIVCPGPIYFDATQPTALEDKLNSAVYEIDAGQEARARACIGGIVRRRLTKYNHAPHIDLSERFPANGRKRVLIVDQRFGDRAVGFGLGGKATFRRMWEIALSLPGHDILLKMHPDAISGKHGSYLSGLLDTEPPPHVHLLDFDINPFCLFDVVDKVFICSSQLGLEALMAGKEVHCFGMPFYAGWGITTDHLAMPRRRRPRSLEEIFHLFYIEHSRYFIPGRGIVPLEELLDYFAIVTAEARTEVPAPCVGSKGFVGKILLIAAGGIHEEAGDFLHVLAAGLLAKGHPVMMWAERKFTSPLDGLVCAKISFDGDRLDPDLRHAVLAFDPQVILVAGGSAEALRAAEAVVDLTGAALVVDERGRGTFHAGISDDDEQERDNDDSDNGTEESGKASADLLSIVPSLRLAPWPSCGVPAHPGQAVVPPSCMPAEFDSLPVSPDERAAILEGHSIPPQSTVFFVGGEFPESDDSFKLLMRAFHFAFRADSRPMAVILMSGTSALPMHRIARQMLPAGVIVADLGNPARWRVLETLKACDVVCAAGLVLPGAANVPSQFLAWAMARGKPALVQEVGFGKSLGDGRDAFLLRGADPAGWASAILRALDPEMRNAVGSNARGFALEHFEVGKVVDGLMSELADLPTAAAAPKRPAGGARDLASIPLRGRFDSTLQDVIHAVAARTHRLDTVVHLGAGAAGEILEYGMLGAGRIHLVEGEPLAASRLACLENHRQTVTVIQAVVSDHGGVQPIHRLTPEHPEGGDCEVSVLEGTGFASWQPGIRCEAMTPVPCISGEEALRGLPLAGADNLLMLELHGIELRLLESLPEATLRRFHWIGLRLPTVPLFEGMGGIREISGLLTAAGFRALPVPADPASVYQACVFERLPR